MGRLGVSSPPSSSLYLELQLIFTVAALNDLYAEISVPDTEIARAWTLVNPSKTPTIAQDQALHFLHLLSQRHDGYRLPRSVPPSLRASFENTKHNYNIEDVAPPQRRNAPDTSTYSGKKAAFGESYLTRLGIGAGTGYAHEGTDFAGTKDEDWEEVRLKKQLAELETKIKQAEEMAEKRRRGDGAGRSTAALVKRELEMMLDYKRKELRDLEEGGGATESGKSVKAVRDDLDMVKEQVTALEGHLRNREEVLEGLQREIEEEKLRRR